MQLCKFSGARDGCSLTAVSATSPAVPGWAREIAPTTATVVAGLI
jgi:hypothetical protein